MKVVVAAFNQEKALVGAFSVITNLRMELFEALIQSSSTSSKMYGLLLQNMAEFIQNKYGDNMWKKVNSLHSCLFLSDLNWKVCNHLKLLISSQIDMS